MSVIGRREFLIAMTMDDQTKRERAALNKGMADVKRNAQSSASAAKRSIVEMAKASKKGIEGLNAVLTLGGWITVVLQIIAAVQKLTEAARANSQAFKEMEASNKLIAAEMGEGLTKAMEPMAEMWPRVQAVGRSVFLNFGEVASRTWEFISNMAQRVFSWDNIKKGAIAIGEGFSKVFEVAIKQIPDMFGNAIGAMFTFVKELGAYILDTLGKAFQLQFDQIIDPGKAFAKAASAAAPQWSAAGAGFNAIIEESTKALSGIGSTMKEIFGDEWERYVKDLGGIINPDVEAFLKKVKEEASKVTKDAGASEKAFVDELKQIAGLRDEWNLKLAQQRGDRIAALEFEREAIIEKYREQIKDTEDFENIIAIVRQYYRTEIMREEKKLLEERKQAYVDAREELLRNYLEEQQAIRDANIAGTNGLIAAIQQNLENASELAGGGGFGALFNKEIGSLIGGIENLTVLLNPMSTFLGAVFEVLEPMVNNLLAPMVGILKILGYVVGKLLAPALELLRPIIEVISLLFMFLYNSVIVPVANLLIRAFNVIYNGFATFINGIIWLVDQIPFVDMTGHYLKMKALDAGTLTTISTTGIAATGASGASGSSASYAAGSSIKIEKIEINAGAVVGDAGLQELAIIIRDEIVEAERLGR